jgi:hypothetical protein
MQSWIAQSLLSMDCLGQINYSNILSIRMSRSNDVTDFLNYIHKLLANLLCLTTKAASLTQRLYCFFSEACEFLTTT